MKMKMTKLSMIPVVGDASLQTIFRIPKTLATCEKTSCQQKMELEDEISALMGIKNHRMVDHENQEQDYH